MSGFEVVGVVLGGLPLIISALEHYAKGVMHFESSKGHSQLTTLVQATTINSMVQYETVFLDIHVNLTAAMTIFKQSCEEVLRGIHLPDTQFRNLVEEQIGWDNQDLRGKLQKRLKTDFHSFEVFVERLRERIDILAKKLKLRPKVLTVGSKFRSSRQMLTEHNRSHSSWSMALLTRSFERSFSRRRP